MGAIKRAILLSGGVDSISLAYGLRPDYAYTINYGQCCSQREEYVSSIVCKKLNITHKVLTVDCKMLGLGSLAKSNTIDISPSEEWWPYRNQLIITLGSMQGIKDKVNEIHLASVKSDSFHKDGTEEFYSSINKLVNYQEGNISVFCKTLDYYSHELVLKYKVPLELITLAHSCHRSNLACGVCPGCTKLLRVRHELNID